MERIAVTQQEFMTIVLNAMTKGEHASEGEFRAIEKTIKALYHNADEMRMIINQQANELGKI